MPWHSIHERKNGLAACLLLVERVKASADDVGVHLEVVTGLLREMARELDRLDARFQLRHRQHPGQPLPNGGRDGLGGSQARPPADFPSLGHHRDPVDLSG